MRVFGLKEQVSESYATIKQYVIDKVLKVARPDIPWSLKDIVRTHRVGNKNPNNPDQPRILLIKFLHWDHKMELYKGRESHRERDIHVGDDLTRRQRQTLKRLADNGKYGYYYRGKLCIKEPKQGVSVESRTYRKAQRCASVNETPGEGMPSMSYNRWIDTNSDTHMDVTYNTVSSHTYPRSPDGIESEL